MSRPIAELIQNKPARIIVDNSSTNIALNPMLETLKLADQSMIWIRRRWDVTKYIYSSTLCYFILPLHYILEANIIFSTPLHLFDYINYTFSFRLHTTSEEIWLSDFDNPQNVEYPIW